MTKLSFQIDVFLPGTNVLYLVFLVDILHINVHLVLHTTAVLLFLPLASQKVKTTVVLLPSLVMSHPFNVDD